jgi:23S rRNA (pseudouridine1915-N3)-methyltransferase
MKVSIVCVGKLKEKYFKDGIDEYKKRLGRYCSFEIIEIPDEVAPENLSKALEEKVKKTESDRILKQVKAGSFVIVMDVKGKRLTSEEFAHKLGDLGVKGVSDVTFVIGGSLGLHSDIFHRADFRFSMSDLTFPHQLARLILVEQVYRGFKILKGEPYAK